VTLDEAYRRYRKPLISWFMCRYSMSREDAEDIVQETFIKARHAPLTGNAMTYLTTIARNVSIDRWRAYHVCEPLESALFEAAPDSVHDDMEMRDCVMRFVELLTPTQRDACLRLLRGGHASKGALHRARGAMKTIRERVL